MEDFERVKIIIPLSKCVSGMKLLQPIVDEKTGTILLPKGSVLNDDSIDRVSSFDHTQVCVEVKSESTIWETNKEDLDNYKAYSDSLKYILSSTIDNNNVDVKKVKQLAKSLIETFNNNVQILACVNDINYFGQYGYMHSLNVALIAIVIGRWNEYSDEQLEKLALAGLLHDIGKVYRDNITNKKIFKIDRKLDSNLAERLIYKRHPISGYEKLVQYRELDIEVLKAVLTHHERCDGSGFPLSLTGDKISELAKIVGLADEYEALRQKHHIFDVIKELRTTQMGCFDIDLLINFCTNIMNYYIGTHVLLNTGEIGEVESIQQQSIYRPIVKTRDKTIDLYIESQVKIEKVF